MSLPFPVISTWDPRATSSGSIDPLGALRAYNAIAGFLLPGVTTITTRVRYLSWLCAGLRLLDETGDAPSGGRAGRVRRQRLLAWERFLVLATAYHAMAKGVGSSDPAWQSLRGISYVRRAIGQGTTSTEFELLSNQAGVGGVGTYWVTMVRGGLVEDESAELTERGAVLGDEFLRRLGSASRERLSRILAGDVLGLSKDELVKFGKATSLDVSSVSAAEIRSLRDALLEPKAQRRLAAAIATPKSARSSSDSFKRLERELRRQRDDVATQIADTMQLARAFEAVHGGLLDQFDRLRSLDLRGVPIRIERGAETLNPAGDLIKRAAVLGRCLDSLAEVPREISSSVRQFLSSVQPILDAGSSIRFLQEMLRHHDRVQGGKLDVSRQPKRPWVELQDGDIVVAPRFAIKGIPEPRAANAFTHPYRIESFAGMLSELGALGGGA